MSAAAYPQRPRRPRYVQCGKEWVDWDFAVIWVTPKERPFTTPTKLLFYSPPDLPHDVPLQRSVQLSEQWTYHRGYCHYPIRPYSHEWHVAHNMAIQVIATYRRHYLARHGQPPHSIALTGGATYHRPTD